MHDCSKPYETYSQPIETKNNISLPRVKWLESKSHNIAEPINISDTLARYHYEPIMPRALKFYELTNVFKHLSLLDRLKRMFKRGRP